MMARPYDPWTARRAHDGPSTPWGRLPVAAGDGLPSAEALRAEDRDRPPVRHETGQPGADVVNFPCGPP